MKGVRQIINSLLVDMALLVTVCKPGDRPRMRSWHVRRNNLLTNQHGLLTSAEQPDALAVLMVEQPLANHERCVGGESDMSGLCGCIITCIYILLWFSQNLRRAGSYGFNTRTTKNKGHNNKKEK